jgi:hypothetical protein
MKKLPPLAVCGLIFLAALAALIAAAAAGLALFLPARSARVAAPAPVASATVPEAVPAASPTPDEIETFLGKFPLRAGAVWTYSETKYSALPDQPDRLAQAEFEVTEQVVEVKTVGADYFARVHQKTTQTSADAEWRDEAGGPPAERDTWLIYHDHQVFSADALPADLDAIAYESLTLEYQFPLRTEAQWCPAGAGDGSQASPCEYAGMRVVQGQGPQQTQVGDFAECYQIGDMFNGGPVLQTFCPGVGVVERRYDHMGTRSGYLRTLTAFSK